MWAICIYCYVFIFIEGSLEVKLPTIWTDEKQSRAEAERTERLEERRSEKRKTVPLKKCAFLQFAHLRPQAKLQKKPWENKKQTNSSDPCPLPGLSPDPVQVLSKLQKTMGLIFLFFGFLVVLAKLQKPWQNQNNPK